MKILFISEIFPSPNMGGEYLRSYGLAKILSQSDHSIYYIFGKESPKELPEDIKFDRVEYFDFSVHNHRNRILNAVMKFRKNKGLIEKLSEVVNTYNPDLIFIDYNYYGQYISFFKSLKLPVIYGTHNVQSRLALQIPAGNIKDKLVRYLVYKIYQFHEKIYLTKANAVISVSENDSKLYSRYINKDKISCIPNFIDENEYQSAKDKVENYLIMPANFNAYQNKVGLQWFLDKVWDSELAENTCLKIIGRNSDKYYKELSKNKNFKNVTAVGEVADMKPFIAAATATVVPLLHGSGTRLKCIESMALKTQLISTSVGAEGVEHDGSILIADEPEKFRDEILNIVVNKVNKTDKAYKVFLEKYSLKGNSLALNSILNNVRN